MIVYTLKNGIAENIRYQRDGYILKTGEVSIPGDEVPKAKALSDPQAWAAMEAKKNAPRLSTDDVIAMLTEKGLINEHDVAHRKAEKIR